ncbi:MAG: hypothetical protein PHP85_13505 [Gallionella sp.]|nr:hypothetical protein [Gallionella sp.]
MDDDDGTMLFNINASPSPGVTLKGVLSAGLQPYYIHSDHLDTPRMITDTAGAVVWQWDNVDPFGNNMADENPTGAGAFSFNLRFPGQYFDRETNTHYNINRDYDPAIGRYVTSDPIGLGGGINTYQYVNSNPLSYSDQNGLCPMCFLIVVNMAITGTGLYQMEIRSHPTRPDGLPWGAGCGDVNSDVKVPDIFQKSCQKHDACYANQCGFEKCNNDFLNDMKQEKTYFPGLPWVYFKAVDIFGGNSYNAAGRE